MERPTTELRLHIIELLFFTLNEKYVSRLDYFMVDIRNQVGK